jgi:hypothetical protein
MKKRWILLGLVALAGAYYGIRHALWLRTPGLDGEFVFKNDSSGQWIFYKYGTRIASCRDGFCRIGKTRKDSEALFEEKTVFPDVYLFDIEYQNPEIDVPAKIQQSILDDISPLSRNYKGDSYWINYHYGDFFYFEPGPFTTCAYYAGRDWCVRRTPNSEKTPPEGLFENRKPRKISADYEKNES